MSNIRAVSLFTGAGGMDVGFERAGISIVFANEIIKEAAETYSSNRDTDVMINDDINNVMGRLDKLSGIDLVFGGPPCQGFSVAGKMNPDDKRSELIFTFLEAVRRVSPVAFIMENVKALGVLQKWELVRKKYLEHVTSMGYTCAPFVLNATEYGVPQKRERVFFIGIKGNPDPFYEHHMRYCIEQQKSTTPSVRGCLCSLGRAGTKKNPDTCPAKITFTLHPVMRKSPYAGMYFNGQGRPVDVDGYANTLPASMGGNKTPFVDEEYLYGNGVNDWVADYHKGLMDGNIMPRNGEAPDRLRRLTVKEAARLQTFPDDYIWCGNKGSVYRQIGNAVPCRLAEAVAKAVLWYMDDNGRASQSIQEIKPNNVSCPM